MQDTNNNPDSENKLKEIRISAKDFIRPPYIKCPNCGENYFGILIVQENRYHRRCARCYYPKSSESSAVFPLPTLSKKIIYLDQFAVSEMMKALNPRTKAFKKNRIDKYWLDLFMKLDKLCKMQLISSPFSEYHEIEAMPFEFRDDLKRMINQLSAGVEFKRSGFIKGYQFSKHISNWLNGEGNIEPRLEVKDVTNGKMGTWTDWLIIDVPFRADQDLINQLRERKEISHDALSNVYTRWKKEGNRNYQDWFCEEWRSFGESVLKAYLIYSVDKTKRFDEIISGKRQIKFEDFGEADINIIMTSIYNTLKKAGIENNKLTSKIKEYLYSDSIVYLPYCRIHAALFAALALKASRGQKKIKSKGMQIDIEMLSVLMPFCDVMYVDRECHNLINEARINNVIDDKTMIYSSLNNIEFINYLDEIEQNASIEYLQKIREVYGDNWGNPYITMFLNE